MSLFEIKNLTYYYPHRNIPALKQINLALEENELLLIVGGSGSGKSSLARVFAGLIPEFYGGRIGGRVSFEGQEIGRGGKRRLLASRVGMVFQDPEKQLVMTSVEAEIAFGLENLGLPQREMFRRVAEVMSFLDLSGLRHRFTASLSGGQKQKVALASVLAMQPRVLILDEPTSQLDPVAADEFLSLVERLNQELGYTVVLIEQRLERCFHLADRLVVMEEGEIRQAGSVREVARWQVREQYPFLPPVAKVFAAANHEIVPLTVKEGRRELRKIAPALSGNGKRGKETMAAAAERTDIQAPALELQDLCFAYPGGPNVLKEINLTVNPGDFLVILGENAAGKSTLLKLIAGLLHPKQGTVRVNGADAGSAALPSLARQVGYLSQNPNDYLFEDTVEDELQITLRNLGIRDDLVVDQLLERLDLEKIRKANPRDLSGGERQRVALASVLVARPQILLLDEPTRGIDCLLKEDLGRLLHSLNSRGLTTIMVTHDVEFAAEYARQVMIMFDGRIAANGSICEVLYNSAFYSPQISRLFNRLSDGPLTAADAVEAIAAGQKGCRERTSV